MLLTIDIGNSNVVFVLFDQEKLVVQDLRIETNKIKNKKEINSLLINKFQKKNISLDSITDIVIASVVPSLDREFNEWAKTLNIFPVFVDSTNANIKIKIDKPNSLGADRIAASVGAISKYGNNLIVIDFGTATTFEVINDKGEYIGGVISPGIRTSIKGLASTAEKLQEYDFKKPKSDNVPTNLEDALAAGIYYGYIGLVKEIILRLKMSYSSKSEITVIATGGLGKQISEEVDLINFYDPNLVSVGLKEIYKELH